jgi:hypothetical protein
MVTSHVTYDEDWERTLEHFGAPRCDQWPHSGLHPGWWPAQWASAWPHERSIPEHYAALMKEDPLAQLAQNLSLRSGPTRTTWLRLGPKGDAQLPGRPANHLSQLSEWVIAPDAGLQKTRTSMLPGHEADAETSSDQGKGKRRRAEKECPSKRKQNRNGQ